MSTFHVKKRSDVHMQHFTTRLPKDIAELLLDKSTATGCTVSETLRHITSSYFYQEMEGQELKEKFNQLQLTIKELGKDIETVTTLLMVATKTASEEDAYQWVKTNLRVGR